jgi:hypothetical protein
MLLVLLYAGYWLLTQPSAFPTLVTLWLVGVLAFMPVLGWVGDKAWWETLDRDYEVAQYRLGDGSGIPEPPHPQVYQG